MPPGIPPPGNPPPKGLPAPGGRPGAPTGRRAGPPPFLAALPFPLPFLPFFDWACICRPRAFFDIGPMPGGPFPFAFFPFLRRGLLRPPGGFLRQGPRAGRPQAAGLLPLHLRGGGEAPQRWVALGEGAPGAVGDAPPPRRVDDLGVDPLLR